MAESEPFHQSHEMVSRGTGCGGGGVGGLSPQALSGPSSSPAGRESLGGLQGQAFSALLSMHIPSEQSWLSGGLREQTHST